MQLKIDLLRHGETTLSHTLRGSTDDDLTELGWQQMQQTIFNDQIDQSSASGYPVSKNWHVIFTSPLKRCALFAETVSEQLSIPLLSDPQLQEMHFGDWEGLSTQYLYENEPELLASFWQQPTQFTPPNAESMQNFQSRVFKALKNIQLKMLENNLQNALIVTHGGVIKLLKCIALQQPLDDILKMSAELGQLNSFVLDSETMQLQLLASATLEKDINMLEQNK